MTVTIYCASCFTPREVKPQDVFQVKRCIPCQKEHAAALRRSNAAYKRDVRNEAFSDLRKMVAEYRDTGKISWEGYCFIKWGLYDMTEDIMISRYGYSECQQDGKSSYPEEDQEYDMSHLGYTEQDVADKLARRGAENLIINEVDCWDDICTGRENPNTMNWYIEDAFRRYKAKEGK